MKRQYAVMEVYFDGFKWFGFFDSKAEAEEHAANFMKKDYADGAEIFRKTETGYELIDFE